MYCSTNSFPFKTTLVRLTFLIAVVALPALGAYAQKQAAADPYQKISFKTTKQCTIPATGEVTALIKSGVELSVTEDWDCDGVPDAFDNCVGMPNPDQTDNDNNGIGDVCEAGATIKAGPPAKSKSNARVKVPAKSKPDTKPKRRKAIASDRTSRSSRRKQRTR
jgi:hypothetical protein